LRTAEISPVSSRGQFRWGVKIVGRGREGEDGKKWSKRAELVLAGLSASRILGHLVGDLPRASFLAIYRNWRVARDRKED